MDKKERLLNCTPRRSNPDRQQTVWTLDRTCGKQKNSLTLLEI